MGQLEQRQLQTAKAISILRAAGDYIDELALPKRDREYVGEQLTRVANRLQARQPVDRSALLEPVLNAVGP